jgi:hypothetical protein
VKSLSALNSIVAVTEYETDDAGNAKGETWEWKAK